MNEVEPNGTFCLSYLIVPNKIPHTKNVLNKYLRE